MGCVCSKRFPDDAPPAPGPLAAAYDARRGRYGPGDFDSGELAIPPPKPPHSHKVPSLPPSLQLLLLYIHLYPPPPSLSLSAACSFLPSSSPPRFMHAAAFVSRLGSRCLIWCMEVRSMLLLRCKFWSPWRRSCRLPSSRFDSLARLATSSPEFPFPNQMIRESAWHHTKRSGSQFPALSAQRPCCCVSGAAVNGGGHATLVVAASPRS